MNYAIALVRCGMYGEVAPIRDGRKIAYYVGFTDTHDGGRDLRKSYKIDPLADTLVGCHQRTALVNWLVKNHYALWNQSSGLTLDLNNPDMLGYTCDRIKWCFEQLEKQE